MKERESTIEILDPELEIKLNRERKESERIQKLNVRTSHCVCKYCGSRLSLRKVTYAAYDEAKIDIYCENCNRMENGTEPLIYKMAEYFVDDMQFDYYPELDPSISKRRMNIAVICDIISWGFKNVGLINDKGFTVDLNVNEHTLGEATVFSKTQLEAMMRGDGYGK